MWPGFSCIQKPQPEPASSDQKPIVRAVRASRPAAVEVIKLIVKHQVPISMSSKPDFSDTIDGR